MGFSDRRGGEPGALQRQTSTWRILGCPMGLFERSLCPGDLKVPWPLSPRAFLPVPVEELFPAGQPRGVASAARTRARAQRPRRRLLPGPVQ